MKQRSNKVQKGPLGSVQLPPVTCAGLKMNTFSWSAYSEWARFANTCEAELIREREIVKMEHRIDPLASPTHTRMMTSLMQAIALARVWERFKKRGDDGGPHKPPRRPSPPPSTTSRVRRRELEDA
ncbi:MAG: hypothetical protein RLZZ234_54 [Candidatus Parcubacteria bacterium]|jgi:hypothetical protein